MERNAQHALIYVLVDPRDGEIRYVGWTTQTLTQRYKSHLAYKSRAHRSKWIQALLRQGLRPIIRLIQMVPVGDGPNAEIYWIKFHRDLGCRLVNLTEGGEGAPGHLPTEETRARMRAAHRGRKHSPETIAKLRLAKSNQSVETRAKIGEANRRRAVSTETRAKISAAARQRTYSPETRAKLSAAGQGRAVSAEARAKIGAANSGRVKSPEARAKISAANRGRIPSPETCAKISAANRGRTMPPAVRAKLAVVNLGRAVSAETRAKISAANRGHTGGSHGPVSMETRAKIAAANYGRKASAETRTKMSAAQKERYRKERQNG